MATGPAAPHDPEHTRLWQHWQQAEEAHLSPTKRSLIVTWLAFGTTFGTARLITHGIRGGWLPWGNMSAGGQHLHHYNLGIAALAGVGLIAVRGDEKAVGHPLVAASYGAGAALIADEFALLLDLQDVYWAKQGRVSVDVAFGLLAGLGAYLTAAPFWHEVIRAGRRHAARRLREAARPR
ncbi:hypothetical protein OG455_37465 [Kitasatospora sp. NBC_01287]|uniref:hypothetical protein n=1 Tax=Kitasatospora sp. NBC_01287 TaxID=2903573 RepID=UPI00224DFFBA|nr:hypothetical protein [Kitasatospora sp. NBC_01287]MCX4751131.1 hypothetical protein [Kitasatospora sp. NBC_01287]